MAQVKTKKTEFYAKPVAKKAGGRYFRSQDQTKLKEGNTAAIVPVPIVVTNPNKVGRPTKYKRKYCDEIIDYFTEAQSVIKITDDPGGKGGTQTRFETMYVPTVRGFAAKIGVSFKTLYTWADEHKEFSHAFERACAIQDAIVEQLGLAGRLGKGLAELYFMNRLEYKDSRHLDITSDDKPIVPITALQLNVNAPDPKKQIEQ